MPSKPLEPGDPVRLGRFELLGRLGEGGQGIVYLGCGTNPGEERVAVKVLRSTADADVLERLARELDAIHQVQPFVTAGVIEASAEGERRYVVSEFIDGPSLQEGVDARGPLPEGALQRLAVGPAAGLPAAPGPATWTPGSGQAALADSVPPGWAPAGTGPAYPPAGPAYPPAGPAYPPAGPGYPPAGPAYPGAGPAYPGHDPAGYPA